MRRLFVMLWLLVGSIVSAEAQVSISIGINLPNYPTLVAVPGYPVYYAPQADANYFFYDGMYWVYQGDEWYASSWYNGPWSFVDVDAVPLYVLRVPVHYYRRPPVYFRGWRPDAPPRWGEHWGIGWEQRHRGWDQWDRRAAPRPAPLPLYQRQYSGNRYPRAEQQPVLQSRNYRYQPRDAVVQQHFQGRQAPGAAAPAAPARRAEPPRSAPPPQDQRGGRPPPVSQGAPADPRGRQGPREDAQPPHAARPPTPAAPPHEVRQPQRPPREQAARQAPQPRGEERGQGRGDERRGGRGDERGGGRGEEKGGRER